MNPQAHQLPSTAASTATYSRPSCREDFLLAIICALKLEFDAVSLIFDQFWDEDGESFGRVDGDTNIYTTGRIGNHDVVLALLPNMGKAAAAGTAASFQASYTNLKLAFLVGVCGGVPSSDSGELLLGDVVVSKTVFQRDFGENYPDRFIPKNTIRENGSRLSKDIHGLIVSFETEVGRRGLQQKAAMSLRDLQAKAAAKGQQHRDHYCYPGSTEDKLFPSTYPHKHRGLQSCDCNGQTQDPCAAAIQFPCSELGCDEGQLVFRKRLGLKRNLKPEEAQRPEVFIGNIASGDIAVKSGEHRDQIAQQYNIIAFRVEGAGFWNEMPCIAVKGICDYADSHKNKV